MGSNMKILIITSMQGVGNLAETTERELGVQVEVQMTPKAGLAALRKDRFDIVVVEEYLVESDPQWADLLWRTANDAMPIVLNFSASGMQRLNREVRSALIRRSADKALGYRAATAELASSLRSPLTGLLLHSQLALRDPSVPANVIPMLENVVALASGMRNQLGVDEEARRNFELGFRVQPSLPPMAKTAVY